jgi:hypothetical protein
MASKARQAIKRQQHRSRQEAERQKKQMEAERERLRVAEERRVEADNKRVLKLHADSEKRRYEDHSRQVRDYEANMKAFAAQRDLLNAHVDGRCSVHKKLRNVRKKLRDIEELQTRVDSLMAEGRSLDSALRKLSAEQREKLGKKQSLDDELAEHLEAEDTAEEAFLLELRKVVGPPGSSAGKQADLVVGSPGPLTAMSFEELLSELMGRGYPVMQTPQDPGPFVALPPPVLQTVSVPRNIPDVSAPNVSEGVREGIAQVNIAAVQVVTPTGTAPKAISSENRKEAPAVVAATTTSAPAGVWQRGAPVSAKQPDEPRGGRTAVGSSNISSGGALGVASNTNNRDADLSRPSAASAPVSGGVTVGAQTPGSAPKPTEEDEWSTVSPGKKKANKKR